MDGIDAGPIQGQRAEDTMRRQSIDDGGWFDLDDATRYVEDTYFDGHNHISSATGSQWVHEALYCTRRGAYVLEQWSQREDHATRWTRITAADAAQWLVANGHDAPAPLADAQAALEV